MAKLTKTEQRLLERLESVIPYQKHVSIFGIREWNAAIKLREKGLAQFKGHAERIYVPKGQGRSAYWGTEMVWQGMLTPAESTDRQ